MSYALTGTTGWTTSMLAKPAFTGTVFAAIIAAMHGTGAQVAISASTSYPLYIVAGVLAAISSVVANLARNAVMPHLSSDKYWQNLESTLLEVGLTAGAFTLLLTSVSGGSVAPLSPVGLFGQAALAEAGSQYAYEQILVPMWLKK